MEKFEIKEEFEISVKRLCLPIIVERPCPKCNKVCNVDLEYDYLSYPTLNKIENINFYCESCDDNFTKEAILELILNVE